MHRTSFTCSTSSIWSSFDALSMHAKLPLLLSLGTLVFAHGDPQRLQETCRVPAIGGGEDDGPAILAAFKECSRDAKIVLDKYYVVDTLLLTKNLENVEIELSGTGEHLNVSPGSIVRPECSYVLSVQYTPDIAKWSPQSLYLTYQNASALLPFPHLLVHAEPGIERLSGSSLVITSTCTAAEHLTVTARFGGIRLTTPTYAVLSHCHMACAPSDISTKIGFRHRGRVINDLCEAYSTHRWECDECRCGEP